jgi:hypothetical protein
VLLNHIGEDGIRLGAATLKPGVGLDNFLPKRFGVDGLGTVYKIVKSDSSALWEVMTLGCAAAALHRGTLHNLGWGGVPENMLGFFSTVGREYIPSSFAALKGDHFSLQASPCVRGIFRTLATAPEIPAEDVVKFMPPCINASVDVGLRIQKERPRACDFCPPLGYPILAICGDDVLLGPDPGTVVVAGPEVPLRGSTSFAAASLPLTLAFQVPTPAQLSEYAGWQSGLALDEVEDVYGEAVHDVDAEAVDDVDAEAVEDVKWFDPAVWISVDDEFMKVADSLGLTPEYARRALATVPGPELPDCVPVKMLSATSQRWLRAHTELRNALLWQLRSLVAISGDEKVAEAVRRANPAGD